MLSLVGLVLLSHICGAAPATTAADSVEFLTFYSNGNGDIAAPADAAMLSSMHATAMTTANLSAIEDAWATHKLGGVLAVDSVFMFHVNPATGKREGGLRKGWQSVLQSKLKAATAMIRAGAIR